MSMRPPPISVWRYDDAPDGFKECVATGGDEDWLALIPKEIFRELGEYLPDWMQEGGPFGCCSVRMGETPAGDVVVVGCHA